MSGKHGHTTGGSGRGARRNGRAGSGRISCQQNCSHRKHKSRVPSKGSHKCRVRVSPEARTSEILCKHLSNPKPGHTTGGSGRGARRSGQAGSGKIGCQQNYSLRKQKSTVLSNKSKKCRFNVSPEARTSEILCKPTEEQNQRLTRG